MLPIVFRASSDRLPVQLLTKGVGLSVVTSATVSTTYTVDAYRPIAGETVVTKMAFKGTSGSERFNEVTHTDQLYSHRRFYPSLLRHTLDSSNGVP
jgi:hypothetical protein